MDRPRILAIKLLQRCEEDGYANLLIKSSLEKNQLDIRDKQFVSALVYGTLEKQYTIDALLNVFLKKPVQKLDADIRAILRCGLYQCRFMSGVPDYAAVNSSVELARRFGKTSASGMVNAVLRKAAAYDVKLLSFADESEKLSVLYNASPSIVDMLRRVYGDQAEHILDQFTEAAPIFLRVNTVKTTTDQLQLVLQAQGVSTAECGYPNALQIVGGDFLHTPAFTDGLFHIQGLSSQVAADIVAAAPGEKVLDLCSAPGGKGLTMAYAMKNKGQLFCRELQTARVPLIRTQMKRCGITCADIAQGDAAQYDDRLACADAVLCDVPCSGTGTLSKKPDIRFKDIESGRQQLTRIQAAILENASRYLRPGGRLVYSTCSLDQAENGDVVKAFLSRHTDFQIEPLSFPDFHTVDDEGMLTLLPENGKNDGFFMAKLIKV